MEKKKITIVTSEIHEVLVVRRAAEPEYRRWCPLCRLDVDMFTPSGAATRLGTSTREIYRQLEAGEMHFTEEPGMPLLVCGNSFRTDLNNRDAHVTPLLNAEQESRTSDSDLTKLKTIGPDGVQVEVAKGPQTINQLEKSNS